MLSEGREEVLMTRHISRKPAPESDQHTQSVTFIKVWGSHILSLHYFLYIVSVCYSLSFEMQDYKLVQSRLH